MRIPAIPFAALLALALLAAPSWAQEPGGLGLDLTDDSSAEPRQEPGMAVDLLPRFALVGLYSPDRADRPVSTVCGPPRTPDGAPRRCRLNGFCE